MQVQISQIVRKLYLSSLQEVKDNLRITHDGHNSLLEGHIDTASTMVENYLGRFVHHREITLKNSAFFQNAVLRFTPVLGDVLITYYDKQNQKQILASTAYVIEEDTSGEPIITYNDVATLPAVYNRLDAVSISYTAGYDQLNIPSPFKAFVLLMTAKLYENPADTALKYASFANSLLFTYKNHSGGQEI